MSALDNIINGIGAAGALGTAAYGLVDITKFFGGGVSIAGFAFIEAAVRPYVSVQDPAQAVFGTHEIISTLRANWMNGMAKADQKAAARSLIRLKLKPETAAEMARLAGVNEQHLVIAAQNIQDDQPLTPQDLKAIGAFDVAVSATLDLGYERGDQRYRNAAKIVAAIIAIALALGGGWLVYGSKSLGLAFLVGIVATPLAPVAKDLSSALQTAVKAVGAFKR